MKIEIYLYDETGERKIGFANETNCQSLIINGFHVIQGGAINRSDTGMSQLSEAVVNMQHGNGVSIGELISDERELN